MAGGPRQGWDYARVAAEWYRQRSTTRPTEFADLIDSNSAAAWHSTEPWSPREVFDRYRRSFTTGEYPPTPVDINGERRIARPPLADRWCGSRDPAGE